METQTSNKKWFHLSPGLVFLGFTAMAIALLWDEHKAHILGILPYLFILACPLMHIFMHGGHSHNHSGENHSENERKEKL